MCPGSGQPGGQTASLMVATGAVSVCGCAVLTAVMSAGERSLKAGAGQAGRVRPYW